MPFPVASLEIEKTEAKTGFMFPPVFKTCLAASNGGDLVVADDDWVLFPFLDGSDRKRLARSCNDIVSETNRMREWRGFPPEGFAIASNGCGDCLLLLPEKEGSKQLGETIFRFDHETGEMGPVAVNVDECQ